MKHSVACCFLTYNHPETVEDVLSHICEEYGKNEIDIYIYDSSEGDETKKIVEKYQKLEISKVYYVDVKFLTSGDEKMLYCLQGKGLEKEYDYIWPTKDRCYFTGRTLEEIRKAIEEDYDIVFAVDEEDRWEIYPPNTKSVYDKPEEFFAHYGQLTTNWEAMIRKTKTMVKDVDWEKYVQQYGLGSNNNFNQLVSTFVRLEELPNSSVRVIKQREEEKKYSACSTSMWRGQTYEIWIEKWIPMINSLPDRYNDSKTSIIKSQLNLPALFGSNDNLLNLIVDKNLTKDRFNKIIPIWSNISEIPIKYVDLLFDEKTDELANDVIKTIHDAFETENYEQVYYIVQQNQWIQFSMDEEEYAVLVACLEILKKSLIKKGYCALFSGVHSYEELIQKYNRLIKQRG